LSVELLIWCDSYKFDLGVL